MRIFTTQTLTVLRSGKHLYRWPRNGSATVEAGVGKVTEFHHDGLVLFSPSGRDLRSAFATYLAENEPLDGSTLGDRSAALLLADQTLVWGEPDKWAQRVDLSAHRSDFLDWADGLDLGRRAHGNETDEDETLATGFAAGTVNANGHGIGVASNYSGNVCLFRPDSDQPVLSFRIKTVDEDRIYARPTKRGLLVTVVFNGRNSRIFLVDEQGQLQAHVQEAAHGRPPALMVGKHIVDFMDTTAIVRNEMLEEVARTELGMRPVTTGAAIDGKHFALADSRGAMMGLYRLSKRGEIDEVDLVCYTELATADKREAARAAAVRAFDVARVPGEPCIGFAAKPIVSPPWQVNAGEFSLPLVVRSAGGPGRGLGIRLSGAALQNVTVERLRVGDLEVKFVPDGDGLLAEAPDLRLREGIVLPLHPKPTTQTQKDKAAGLVAETHLELAVEGSAKQPSNAILRVEMWALGASSSRLKWMRPLTIA